MKWLGGGALALFAAATLGGCAHEQSTQESASMGAITPVAESEANRGEASFVAGHEEGANAQQPAVQGSEQSGVILQPQGRYQVPQGRYQVPQGEYFAPQGVYGQRGRIVAEGQILQQGTYGTFTKPEGTVRQPLGVTAQPEGMAYKAFGSSQVSSERQPVAGKEQPQAYFFVRDQNGQTWAISDPTLIRRVEQKLSDQGCNPGSIDGKADEQFGKALMQCQDKLGVQPTGVIDQQTARALGVDWSTFRKPMQRYSPPAGQKSGGATGEVGHENVPSNPAPAQQ